MSTFVERNFRVKGVVDCAFVPPSGYSLQNIAGIEIQLWHQSPMQEVFLGKGITDESGEYVIDIEVDSPVSYIVDGQIENVFIKAFYNGESLIKTTYDPDAQLYFDQLRPQPSAFYKTAIDILVRRLKQEGVWAILDRLWIFATEYQEHARINLKAPSSPQLTEITSPTWTASEGYAFNGSSSYIETNFIPSSDCEKAILNSASLGVYLRTNVSGADVTDFGATDGSVQSGVYAKWSDNSIMGSVHSTGPSVVSTGTSASGLTGYSRTASNNVNFYRNGTLLGSGSASSSALPTTQMYIGAMNNNGSPLFMSTRQISMAYYGSGNIDNSALYSVFQDFATMIGFNV